MELHRVTGSGVYLSPGCISTVLALVPERTPVVWVLPRDPRYDLNGASRVYREYTCQTKWYTPVLFSWEIETRGS